MEDSDLNLRLERTHVVVTGGSGYIGSATVKAFLAAGAYVTVFDLVPPKDKSTLHHLHLKYHLVDVSNEAQLADAFEAARRDFGVVQCCVALASLDLSALQHHESIMDMPVEQWRRTMRVNVEGTFLTAKTWLRQIKGMDPDMRNVGLIIVGSESGHFGERMNADYASGKSAVQVGLVQSLKNDVVRVFPKARVNAVAPGPVNTPRFQLECKQNPDQYWLDAQATTALAKPVPPTAVAKSILFLTSEAWSGYITGQILNVDCGKQGKVMWMQQESKGPKNT
ncbi:MAG: hypothetical protein LQ338_007310 [Usnochroma carphineum]|nr:MAG: hypothetical protein LQ338_007310 [Usnochroma carphineum]